MFINHSPTTTTVIYVHNYFKRFTIIIIPDQEYTVDELIVPEQHCSIRPDSHPEARIGASGKIYLRLRVYQFSIHLPLEIQGGESFGIFRNITEHLLV